MDPQGVALDFEVEPVTVIPFVDRTLQALQQLIKENRDYTEAQAAAVQKQVMAAQKQSALAEKRATEAERRNQELFAKLQRDTLATQASMQQAVSASVATITTWVAGQETRILGNKGQETRISGNKSGPGTTPSVTESESEGRTHRVRVLGVDKMDSKESERFWRDVGKGRLPGRHQRGHTAAYQAAVDRSTAKLRARERANPPVPLTQGDSSGIIRQGPGNPISTSRSTAPVHSQSARVLPRQLEGVTGPTITGLPGLTLIDRGSNVGVSKDQPGWGSGAVKPAVVETRFAHYEDAIIVQLCAEAAEFATVTRDWDRWVTVVKPTAKLAFQRYIPESEGWGGIWGSLPRLIEDLYLTEREPWTVRPQAARGGAYCDTVSQCVFPIDAE